MFLFICTRVQLPTEESWGKLRRVLNYLKAKKYSKRIMGSYNVLKLETFIYAPRVLHEDTGGETGGCISCGVCIFQGKASKLKLGTKITTESEMVAVSEYVPYKIHVIIFFGDKAIFCTEMLYTKTTKAQLI